MLADPTTEQTTVAALEPFKVRAHVREAEQAARGLIARAAHLEKRAERPRADDLERMRLRSQARELRAAAGLLLAEISELSRQVRPSQGLRAS
jgi:hypothetical protein